MCPHRLLAIGGSVVPLVSARMWISTVSSFD
jgi:hypothetical protein